MSDQSGNQPNNSEEALTAKVAAEIDAIQPNRETDVGKKILKQILAERGLREFIKAAFVYLKILDRQTEFTMSDLDHRDLIDGTPDNDQDYKHDDTEIFEKTSANLLSRRMALRLGLLGFPAAVWASEGIMGTADRIYEHTLDPQNPGPGRKPSLTGRLADRIDYELEYPAELSIGIELATELPHMIKTWKLTQLANALGELAEKNFDKKLKELKKRLAKTPPDTPAR